MSDLEPVDRLTCNRRCRRPLPVDASASTLGGRSPFGRVADHTVDGAHSVLCRSRPLRKFKSGGGRLRTVLRLKLDRQVPDVTAPYSGPQS